MCLTGRHILEPQRSQGPQSAGRDLVSTSGQTYERRSLEVYGSICPITLNVKHLFLAMNLYIVIRPPCESSHMDGGAFRRPEHYHLLTTGLVLDQIHLNTPFETLLLHSPLSPGRPILSLTVHRFCFCATFNIS